MQQKSSQVCDLENRGFGNTFQQTTGKIQIFLFCGGQNSAGAHNKRLGPIYLCLYSSGVFGRDGTRILLLARGSWGSGPQGSHGTPCSHRTLESTLRRLLLQYSESFIFRCFCFSQGGVINAQAKFKNVKRKMSLAGHFEIAPPRNIQMSSS